MRKKRLVVKGLMHHAKEVTFVLQAAVCRQGRDGVGFLSWEDTSVGGIEWIRVKKIYWAESHQAGVKQ